MARSRTTLIIDDQLLRQAKKKALEMNKTLTEYVEEALRAKEAIVAEPPRVYDVPSFRGAGNMADVDLSKINSADALMLSDDELFDRMKREDDSS